jgi:hypothetical protein
MDTITLCYSTHRTETLELTTRLMEDHEVIIVEEPFHADFAAVLRGALDIKDHLLELDLEYPEFTAEQYSRLQQLSQKGKTVLQTEPYLEHLLRIHYFFADGHGPTEIAAGTTDHAVYSAEHNATGTLITFYKEVQGGDFNRILSAMNAFARADAERFVLRDTLRARSILGLLFPGKKTFIEAGSIHQLLFYLLADSLPSTWTLRSISIDDETAACINGASVKNSLFSPGDELTLSYIFGRSPSSKMWKILCARSLIYSKILKKEEISHSSATFPHTRNELDSISAVQQLSLEACRGLFQRIKTLSSEESSRVVHSFLHASS